MEVGVTSTEDSVELDEITALKEKLERMEREMSELKEKLDEKCAQNERNAGEMREDLNKMRETAVTVQKMYRSIINQEAEHLRVVNDYYKESADFTWVIHDMAKLLNRSRRKLYSPVFSLQGYPFKAQARLKIHRDHVTFSLAFKDETDPRRKLKVRPIPNVFCTFRDQEDQGRADLVFHGHYSHVRPLLKYDAFDNYAFRPLSLARLTALPYTVDDTLSVAVHVESARVARLVHSYDGELTWAIDDFRRKKEAEALGLAECCLSPYFYTSPNGYRVRARVCLNGHEAWEGAGLSVHVSLLNGLNDDNFSLSLAHHLALLFRSSYHKTTFTVFHPTKHYLSLSKSVENGLRDYWIDVGTHAQIEHLLYNDTLYYKVSVEEILRPSMS